MRSPGSLRRSALALVTFVAISAVALVAPRGQAAHAAIPADTVLGEGGGAMVPVMDKLLQNDGANLTPEFGSYTDVNNDAAIADFVGRRAQHVQCGLRGHRTTAHGGRGGQGQGQWPLFRLRAVRRITTRDRHLGSRQQLSGHHDHQRQPVLRAHPAHLDRGGADLRVRCLGPAAKLGRPTNSVFDAGHDRGRHTHLVVGQ